MSLMGARQAGVRSLVAEWLAAGYERQALWLPSFCLVPWKRLRREVLG